MFRMTYREPVYTYHQHSSSTPYPDAFYQPPTI